MKKIFYIVTVLACLSVAFAGTIRKITFPGIRAFSTAELEGYLGIFRGDSLDLELLPNRLRALEDSLVAKDYLLTHADSVTIDTARRGRLNLVVYLNLGSLAQVREVRWQGDSLSVMPKTIRAARIHAGASFRWASLFADIEAILNDLSNRGWPFARVTILDIVPQIGDVPEVDVVLKIQKGPQTRVNFLQFTGNKLTKPRVLERQTRLRLGSLYSETAATRARRHLRRLPFLSSVGAPEIVFDLKGQTGLAFRVTESPSTRIDFAAGYLPGRTGGQKGTFTGLVDLTLLNLAGTGRRALVHWDRPNRTVQTIRLGYEEPWVAGLPLALGAGFEQRIEDTLYVKRAANLRATAALTEAVEVWGAARYDEVIPDSASRVALGIRSTHTSGVEVGLLWDTRDWPRNPRSGAMFSTLGGLAWRRASEGISIDNENHYQHNSAGVDAEIALEVFPRWVGDIAIHGRMLESNEPEIPLPDLFRLGGARSLRGYREEQFLGSRIGWTNVELRYWLGPSSRFFGFVDGGAYFRERWEGENRVRLQGFKVGSGIGIRIETGVGVWGFDYALGEGDRVLSGKVHLSLSSEF
ncbi:MAG: POTRA domain-containing protein [bacterium]